MEERAMLLDEQELALLDVREERIVGASRVETVDQGMFYLFAGTAPGAEAEVLREMRHELARIREARFSEGEIDDEALIPREDMVVTVTHGGYVKRTPLAAYRTQRRGGRGRGRSADRFPVRPHRGSGRHARRHRPRARTAGAGARNIACTFERGIGFARLPSKPQ